MDARMMPCGPGDTQFMGDGLKLDFIRPFEPVEASHVVAEHPGSRVVRPGSSVCLIFSVHGGLVVQDGRAELELQENAALLLAHRGAGTITLTNRCEADFYLLRFRWTQKAGAAAGQALQVPSHVTVLRPGRLTHLLRMYIEKAKGETTGPNPPSTGVPVRGIPRTSMRNPPSTSMRNPPSTSMRLMLHHLLVLALCELARSSQEGIPMPAREPGLANIASRVDAFIAAHYHETLSTPDIAAELRYNPDYLERAYRQERRMSIREAIHARRINEARAQLLLLRKQGVAQIAALCGYTDAGYFRRLFKRATHMTPHGYRAVNTAFLPDGAPRAAGKALHQ
jgi:AraC-like DNA-binding protein